VIRGGSWNNEAHNCRSAIRNNNEPGNRNNNLGFRLASSRQRPDAARLRTRRLRQCPDPRPGPVPAFNAAGQTPPCPAAAGRPQGSNVTAGQIKLRGFFQSRRKPAMLHILHLSDLHFGTQQDAENWYSQLADDLTGDLDCRRLDVLIISGDIATFATPEEYQAAEQFITALSRKFSLEPSRIVIVPGNHDLNWPLSKKAYELKDRENCEALLTGGCYIKETDTIVRLRDEERYKERFLYFSEFYQSVKGEPYPLEYGRQGIPHDFEDLGLLVLGLNSAWEVDHHYRSRATIQPDAVSMALNRIRDHEAFQKYLKFAVWHHPLNSKTGDSITDHGFMERLAHCGFCACLHGHIHKAETGLYRYDMSPDGRKLHVISAGTFGAPIPEWAPGHPLQYNLLVIEDTTLTVNTRCRIEPNGAWKPDAIWAQGPRRNPLPHYTLDLPSDSSGDDTCQVSASRVDERPTEMPYFYKKWVAGRCRYMDIDRLREKGRVIQVGLPEMYIPLLANPPAAEKEKGTNKETIPMEKVRADRITDLLAGREVLLVEGQPGSGKTTLAKHLAFNLSQGKTTPLGDGWLPVIVFLREMQGLSVKDKQRSGADAAERLLGDYFRRTGCGLDLETVMAFCRAGKALFLVDGLDEIDRGLRDVIAQAFADFISRYEGCKIMLSGRPHGIDGQVVDRFGAGHIRILPLTMEQVEDFITRWFQFVYDEASSVGKKTSRDMIGEVRAHPRISQLIENPLMLTAVCLLYHDGNELPGQRAALYKKFIQSLLYRRFDDPEKVLNFLMRMALKMQVDALEGIDRATALGILSEVYTPKEDEHPAEFRQRLDRLFERIEPDCGLLTLKSGQYAFRHLTFQEFLAAVALINSETDYVKAVDTHWEDETYQEVNELFIGALSIENKRWANQIVEGVFEKENMPPFFGWRLAARALLDIHPDRREPEVESAARDRLIQVMASKAEPKIRAQAGETLGWIGDRRNLKVFVPISGGKYKLPLGTKKIEPFEMAQYPVTNGWFAKFVDAGGYNQREWWSEEGLKWKDHAGTRHPRFWYERRLTCPNAPVVGVCWYEASAFAKWLTHTDPDGNRYYLPDEFQWEAAAAGSDKREYPWGKKWRGDRCNSEKAGIGKPSAVGLFPAGDTPEGICDMAGNVWEWTRSDYHSKRNIDDFPFDSGLQEIIDRIDGSEGKEREELIEKYRELLNEKDRKSPVFRGGSWSSEARICRSAFRFNVGPGIRNFVLGFRLARSVALDA
jgi:formylglycine-generating enzyme required for sulfatase activity/RecA/RadA recombinase